MNIKEFYDLLETRPIILDGAIGTELLKTHKGRVEKLNSSDPLSVLNVHKAYADQGSDILLTNTFDIDTNYVENIAVLQEGAYLAKLSKKNSVKWIAGVVGPSAFDNCAVYRQEKQVIDHYIFHIKRLITSGVDYILFESFPNFEYVKAAMKAFNEATRCTFYKIPFAVTLSTDPRRFDPDIYAGFIKSMKEDQTPLYVGFNCIPIDWLVYTIPLSKSVNIPFCLKPSVDPSNLEEELNNFAVTMEFLKLKGAVDLIGACCGSTPAFINVATQLNKFYSRFDVNKQADNT